MNQPMNPTIYLGCLAILLILFILAGSGPRKLAVLGFVRIVLFALLERNARSEDVRDASGKLITRSVKANGVETVRDASGKIQEVRETRGGTTTVRDASGKPIRTERK